MVRVLTDCFVLVEMTEQHFAFYHKVSPNIVQASDGVWLSHCYLRAYERGGLQTV
jgi:hypothetical protein